MAFIHGFHILLMGEAHSKNRIDTTTIKGVADYNLVFSLISDTSLVKARGMEAKSMGLEIYDNFSIPWFILIDQE